LFRYGNLGCDESVSEGIRKLSIVTLVSGGLDSSLMTFLAKEENITQYPLIINYGQRCFDQELSACKAVLSNLDIAPIQIMDLHGFGEIISSSLTKPDLRISEDAFLPGRNLLFLLAGAAYAYETSSNSVAIGLLSEDYHLFPDQTKEFVSSAEQTIQKALGRSIKIITPLIEFTKKDVLRLAEINEIIDTYSCHMGTSEPCGECISCKEILNARKEA